MGGSGKDIVAGVRTNWSLVSNLCSDSELVWRMSGGGHSVDKIKIAAEKRAIGIGADLSTPTAQHLYAFCLGPS